ncbi:hypothetical protein FRC12_010418 [Ceratobasidium sp. 428]|nr:hypothetical protein FRC12_010418 [Ceratobasidium sp. 428]
MLVSLIPLFMLAASLDELLSNTVNYQTALHARRESARVAFELPGLPYRCRCERLGVFHIRWKHGVVISSGQRYNCRASN